VAMKFRFTPEAQYIYRLLQKGELGKPYYGYTHYLRPPDGIPTGASNWFISKKKAGGGALIDNGVHLLDLNWYLMGCPKPVSAFGMTYNIFGSRVENKKDTLDVEDFGCGLIKYGNGATIYLDNAWACMVANTEAGLRVCGTEAGATMFPFSIIKTEAGRIKETKPDLTKMVYQNQFEHFIGCIANDTEPASPVSQGLSVLKMIHGVYRSAETGSAVNL
jgi:predicted dehydrogenase